MCSVTVAACGDDHSLADAAQIWAEATAARDGATQVAPLDLSLPLIEAVIHSSPRSLLMIARDGGGRALGFAALEPIGSGEDRASLRYLGVRPEVWSRGVADELLRAVHDQLVRRGFTSAELYVYTDNARAVDLYRRLGWVREGDVRRHPKSGRYEERFTLRPAGESTGGQ